MDLLKHLLEKDPQIRYTAVKALQHPWLQKYMTSEVKDGLANKEGALESVQKNMKKFQEKFLLYFTRNEPIFLIS